MFVMNMISVPEKHRQILISPGLEEWKNIINHNKSTSKISRKLEVGCAHECSLYHPGVLFKEICADRFDTNKANIVCDTEIPQNNFFKFPLQRKNETIKYFSKKDNLPYFLQPPPSKKIIKEIIKKTKSNSQTNKFFSVGKKILNKTNNLAQFITKTRIIFLKEYGCTLEQIYLSNLIKGQNYKEFYEKIRSRKKDFIEIYNLSLEENEYNTGIKKLNQNELPFWYDRHTSMPVPKAIPLSIYIRMYVFDLYIEGVGGSRYHPSADYIIRNFFNFEPPKTAVASATLWHEGEKRDIERKIARKRKKIRRMEQNPQEFINNRTDSKEIALLIEKLNKVEHKKEVYIKISEKKDQIKKKIKKDIQKEKNILTKLEAEINLISRDYPFFIYPKEDIIYLFEVKK
ncbi:MAG: hypothetical protein ACOC5R_00590 [Elusimicrobiota bacterium]